MGIFFPIIGRNLNFTTNMIAIRLLCLFIGCFIMITYLRQKSNNGLVTDKNIALNNGKKTQSGSPKNTGSPLEKYLKMKELKNNVIVVNEPINPKSIAPLSDVEKYKQDYPLNPMDLSKPLGKHCVKDRDVRGYLSKVRQVQQELVSNWSQLSGSNVLKWTSLTGLYDPEMTNFNLFYNFVSDLENKYFIDFNQRDNPDCNVVSFGVGMDYSGEVSLYNRYSQCKFTAVDPLSYVNKEMVEYVPGARFFEAAIGAKGGKHVASIRDSDKKYKTKVAEHVGITDFLQKVNGNKMIDLLLMDIEGGEFGVLPTLIDEKHLLPTVCQINFELHYPPETYDYTPVEVFEGLYKFFNDGTYTIFNMEIWRRFHRIYVVNTANSECVKKFFC